MRYRSLLLVILLLIVACGDDDAASTSSTLGTSTTAAATTTTGLAATTTTTAPTTTTTAPLNDPRFASTSQSAYFALPDTGGFGEGAHLALFYRTSDDQLVLVVTGFEPATLQCGWMYVEYGPASVLEAPSWGQANWEAFANQPWATEGATAEPRCEQEFLEDGALRPDIALAVQCGDYLVVVADQMELDAVFVGSTVAAPTASLLVDFPDDAVVALTAIPWFAHPGEHPTVDDLVEVGAGVLDCSLPG